MKPVRASCSTPSLILIIIKELDHKACGVISSNIEKGNNVNQLKHCNATNNTVKLFKRHVYGVSIMNPTVLY